MSAAGQKGKSQPTAPRVRSSPERGHEETASDVFYGPKAVMREIASIGSLLRTGRAREHVPVSIEST